MTLDLKCRSCGSDNTQRLSVMNSQQSYTGMAGQTKLAALKPPSKPWAFTIGFVLGLIALVIVGSITGKDGGAWSGVSFLAVWFGVGFWLKSDYQNKFTKWQDYLEENFICLRCGTIFRVGVDPGRAQQVKEEKERASNRRLGYGVLFGFLIFVLSIIAYKSSSPDSQPIQSSKLGQESDARPTTKTDASQKIVKGASRFEYQGLVLGSGLATLSKSEYNCSPSTISLSKMECKKINPGKIFGVPASKVELMFHKNRLYIIFVGFSPGDTPVVGKELEKRYGKPTKAGELLKGVYQATWRYGDREVVLDRSDRRGSASITLIDYEVGEVPK